MNNFAILRNVISLLGVAPLGVLVAACGAPGASPDEGGREAQPAAGVLGPNEREAGGGVRPFVPPASGASGRAPGGRPRDGGSCEFGGFAWQARPFALYPDEQTCLGDQWVRHDESLGLWVGLTTCADDETRVYLAASPEGPFAAAADTAGHGQDQCELVNADFTLADEDDITSGGCSECSTGPNLPLEGLPAYARGYLGEPFAFVASTPEWSHQVSRLRCGVALGCGAPPAGGGPVVVNDCAGEGSAYVAPRRPGGPELLVIGVYETRNDHSFDYHPTGEASVRDTRPEPHVLVLSSYEPTHWTIEADASSGLTEVILNGYHEQTVSAPGGVAVIDRSGLGNYFSACGYTWPSDDQGCDTPALVGGAEALSGRPLSSFNGCYRATSFEVRADARPAVEERNAGGR